MSNKSLMTSDAILQALGRIHQKEFRDNETLRRPKEQEWAEDLRAIRGIYDPEVAALIPENASKVYPKYTRSKVIPCIAKLNSLLFPANDRNFRVDPTPSPELTDMQMMMIAQDLALKAGDPGTVTQAMVDKAVMEFARTTATAMQTEMDDQLREVNFVEKVAKPVIKNGVYYGTGILKGPMVETGRKTSYSMDKGTGKLQKIKKDYRRPYPEFTPIWFYYPDMSVTDQAQCGFEYQLHRMSRYDLLQLAKRDDFNEAAIKEYVEAHPAGNYRVRNWEQDLQNIGDDAADKISANRYELQERWGWVDGYDLRAAGADIPEESLNEPMYAQSWLLGDRIIKLVPEEGTLFNIFYLEKDESSIFGNGLPRSVRDSQITICSSWRAMLDNAAITAGPIGEGNTDLMDPDDAATLDDLYSRRMIKREGRGAEANYPALRFYNMASHIAEYVQIIEMAKRTGDEESAFPAIVFGEPIAAGNETVGGMSIRSSNMAATIGDVVKNFDACFGAFLRGLYDWNMDPELNPKLSIKGDLNVVACGYSSLLPKETRIMALDSFAGPLGPLDEPYIKRGDLRRMQARMHDLNPEEFMRTDEEAQDIIANQRDQEAEALVKAQAAAEVRYTEAKAEKMSAGARAADHGSMLKTVDTLARTAKSKVDAETKKTDTAVKAAEAIMSHADRKAEKKKGAKK